MKIASFLLLLLIQPMSPAASGAQRREDLDGRLQTNVGSYQLQADNFVEALARVASDFKIPIGIEWVDLPATRDRVNLTWKNATMREVIQAIVKTQPGFTMLVGNGIVHVSSPDLIRDHENPLNLKINTFEVHNALAEAASRQLHEAVRRALLPPKPQEGFARSGGIVGSGFSNTDDPKISVTLKNATVEDVLDALALASVRKIWIVTFSNDRTLTPAGYRRTVGLWNRSHVPDDEQPVWDMFHWGDAIPFTVPGKN